jgi:transposase
MSERTPGECPHCEERKREQDRLLREIDRLKKQVESLTAALEDVRRAGKRQAAPFRKKAPKPNPQKPGRKPGEDYGEHHRRAVPETIDETYEAPLPVKCPGCGGSHLTEISIQSQYQVEIPRRPITREFHVHVGRCDDCGSRVQGRHELQTSDALGAAAVQFGPDAHAAMAWLNKDAGLSHGKVASVFENLFGIDIDRSTSARSIHRTATRLEPVDAEIREAVRTAPSVVPDETGWRIGGESAWLHAFVTDRATCYVVHPNRSADPLAEVIGWDYPGTLIHDGWSPYERFKNAHHQQCVRHLLNRGKHLLETAMGGAVRFPRAVRDVLGRALETRDRFETGEITDHGRLVLRGRLRAELERLVTPIKVHPGNETFAAFLESHLDDVFEFLRQPGIDATNYRAEQAIRPAVVNRKVWGGNRTAAGARDQSILMSVLRTCHQRALDALDFLSETLRTPSTALVPTLAG